MSLEKGGFSTHNDEAEAHSTPKEQEPTVRASTGEKVFLTFGAVSSSFGIALLYRQLHSLPLDHRLQKIFTSLQNALTAAPLLKLQQPPSPHEILLCTIVILVPIYCYCIVRLFAEQEWRQIHLPRVCGVIVTCLLVGAFLTKDLATVFLEVFTGTLNMGVICGLVAHAVLTPKTDG